MFTGIIEAVGSIRALEPRGGDVRLRIATGKLDLGGAVHVIPVDEVIGASTQQAALAAKEWLGHASDVQP